METEHSPGPWRLGDYSPDGGRYVEDGEGSLTICELWGLETSYPEADSEALANGNLIVAAPELLAALEQLISDLDIVEGVALEQANRAITKARGHHKDEPPIPITCAGLAPYIGQATQADGRECQRGGVR